MGMYTELFLQVELKEDTPPEVLQTLRVMLGESDADVPTPFESTRWKYMLRTASFYHYPYAHSFLDGKPYVGFKGHFLFVRCDFKNYNSELSDFLNWIAPHVVSNRVKYQGYWLYEEDDEPTRIQFIDGKVDF